MLLRFVALTALGLLLVGVQVRAADVPDLLDTPALSAPRAGEAALLDLTRTGDTLVAVGERGVVLTRAAGDADWVQSPTPVSVTLAAVAFNADRIGLAVGHDGVILRSTDGGKSWARITDGRALFPVVIEAAKARHAAAEVALATATEETREDLEFELDDQLFRLETAEQSMAFGPSWPLLDVLFTDATTAWAVGAYGMLFLSTDAGESWDLVSDRVDNFEDLHLNALLQTRAGSLLIAGEGGMLFRSTDQGASFERWDTDDALSLFGLAENGDTLVAYGFGDSYQISADDGASWQSQGLPDNLLLIGDVVLGPGRIGLLGGSGLMVEVGADGAEPGTRPTDSRDFLSGGLRLEDGQIVLVGEAGLAGAVPGP
ncbi:MAG: YCF48-related protein [Pseudomonadota bacterium]